MNTDEIRKLLKTAQPYDVETALIFDALPGLLDRIEKLEDSLEQIDQWAKAYPLAMFPEPDWKKAAKVLKENGMTLDAISASNMRHVITRVQEIAALTAYEDKADE